MSPAEVSQAEAHAHAHAARPRDARWLARRLWLGARIVWHAIWHLINDGGLTYAGHIAFMTLFSSFPFLIFLTTLAAEIGQTEAAQELRHLGAEPASERGQRGDRSRRSSR